MKALVNKIRTTTYFFADGLRGVASETATVRGIPAHWHASCSMVLG